MDPDNTLLDQKRAKFLILKVGLPLRTRLSVHVVARRLALQVAERVRVDGNRVKGGLLRGPLRQLSQIES